MLRLLLPLALLAAPAAAVPPRKFPPVAARDWSRTLVRLPDGAYRLGNPAAKVKLIEYLSLTCSHCAHFERTALRELTRDYIRPGRVSIEFRHAVRDGFDMAASLLVRCGGPVRYLRDMDATFATQETWLAKAQTFVPPTGLPDAAMPAAFADGAGLTDAAAARGLPRARAAACLADPAQQKLLLAMRTDAFETRRIEGTPGFVLNGALTGVSAWEPLKPLIDAALR